VQVGQHIGALDYLLPDEYVQTMRVLHHDAPSMPLQAEIGSVTVNPLRVPKLKKRYGSILSFGYLNLLHNLNNFSTIMEPLQ